MVDVLYQKTIDGENVEQDTCTYSMGIKGKQGYQKVFYYHKCSIKHKQLKT